GLGLGREILRGVELAQRFAEQVVEQMHAARCAVELLRLAAQHLAVELEVGVVEGLGQVGGKIVQIVGGQIVPPYRDRRLGENLGESGEGGVLGHHDL